MKRTARRFRKCCSGSSSRRRARPIPSLRNKKVGLLLSGGSGACVAACGVARALEEAGRSWIDVRRSWRLNERHYGALQGLNKAETAAKHGEEQVKIWRRSYDIAPPGGEIATYHQLGARGVDGAAAERARGVRAVLMVGSV